MKICVFYTGLTSYTVFQFFVMFFNPGLQRENVGTWSTLRSDTPKAGRPRSLTVENELFLFLVRMRLGLFEKDLADRFCVDCNRFKHMHNLYKLRFYQVVTSEFMVLKFSHQNYREPPTDSTTDDLQTFCIYMVFSISFTLYSFKYCPGVVYKCRALLYNKQLPQ